MRKFLILILSFLVFSSWSQYKVQDSNRDFIIPPATNNNLYKVIGVKDGDTVVLLIDGKAETLRLAHIDCPEKAQPFGTKAKNFVSDFCFGKMVVLKDNNQRDRYGRMIAEILLPDGKNLNKELVKNGLAWHFIKYSKEKEYANLEIQARKRKAGLWSDPDATPPWEWRKSKKKKLTYKP